MFKFKKYIFSSNFKIFDDSNVKICKFNKDKGIAILNKNDKIFFKLDNIIDDKSKFSKIENKSKSMYEFIKISMKSQFLIISKSMSKIMIRKLQTV